MSLPIEGASRSAPARQTPAKARHESPPTPPAIPRREPTDTRSDAHKGADHVTRSKPVSHTKPVVAPAHIQRAEPVRTPIVDAPLTKNFVTKAIEDGDKLVIAHKGGATTTMTTLRGIEAQAKHGRHTIEVKSRELKDGTLVAYPSDTLVGGEHDGDPISDYTLPQLRELPDYETIPTLDEVGETAQRLGVTIAADIEAGSSDEQRERVVSTLDTHLPAKRVTVFSRDAATDASLRSGPLRQRTIDAPAVDPATTPGETVEPNTIDSLRQASMDGVTDAVEADFHRLGDGTIVVYHDPAISESGPLAGKHLTELTLKDLRENGFDWIPTATEFAAEANRLDTNLVLDIKDKGYEQDVVETVRAQLPDERITAFSFDPFVVEHLDREYPNIPIGFLPYQYDASNAGERIRQQVLGTAIDQIEALPVKPDYVEISASNVNKDVLDYLGRRDITAVTGGTSRDLKVELYEDDRILGFMVNTTAVMPGIDAERYDPDVHGTIPEAENQSSIWDNKYIPEPLRGPLRNGANELYSDLASTEEGTRFLTRVTNTYRDAMAVKDSVINGAKLFGGFLSDTTHDGVEFLTNGADAVRDTVVLAPKVAGMVVSGSADAVGDAFGAITDGDDDVKYVPFL